jgi:cytidine deaminase
VLGFIPDDIQNMMEQAVAVRKKSICTLFKIPSRRSSPVRQWTNCSRLKSRERCISLSERVAIFQAGAIYPEAKILKWLLPQLPTPIKQ